MNLDADAVLLLAPDASSAKAARGLVSPSQWPTLGANEHAVWGECQGSGSKPYQTQVDLSGPTFRCTCPSRKFPCKHGLALLLIRAQDPARLNQSAPPAWVSEWLTSRAERAQKKEEKQREAAAAPADPEAAARAIAQRWKRIDTATRELQRWLGDQLRRGLGNLGGTQGEWDTAAARLVDAQAPGLAQRLRDAGERVGDSDHAADLLQRLGLIQLACEAVQRRDTLSPEAQADLRALLGWPIERTDVLAASEPVHDRWVVLGQLSEEREGRLVERRVWLQGEATGRRALLLDHSFGGKGFEHAWLTGNAHPAALAFYPGAAGLRALPADITGAAQPAPWPVTTRAGEWQHIAARVSACPWVPLHPMLTTHAVPHLDDGIVRLAHEGEDLPMRLGDDDRWTLLAVSGGHPLAVMGEWDGQQLRPLAARGRDGLWQRSEA